MRGEVEASSGRGDELGVRHRAESSRPQQQKPKDSARPFRGRGESADARFCGDRTGAASEIRVRPTNGVVMPHVRGHLRYEVIKRSLLCSACPLTIMIGGALE